MTSISSNSKSFINSDQDLIKSDPNNLSLPSSSNIINQDSDKNLNSNKDHHSIINSKLNQSDSDENLCRICLSGRHDSDPSLGRFIQPCLCRGTMAYIHVGCLQRWRLSSPSLKSFYRCDQCGYRYKLRRAKIAGLAENSFILGAVTLFVFFLLVIIAGFFASWILESYNNRTSGIDHSAWNFGFNSFSYDSTGKVFGEIVGEAVNVLNSKLHINSDQSTNTNQIKPSSFSNHHHHHHHHHHLDDQSAQKLKPIEINQDNSISYRYVKINHHQQPSKIKNNHLHSQNLITQSKSNQNLHQSNPSHLFHSFSTQLISNFESIIKHTIKGLAFIGVMGLFQLAMSITLFSPWNFGIRNSILRIFRGSNNNHPRIGTRDSSGISSLLILIFVLLGVLKSIQGVWKFVKKSSQWILRKIEDGVLDVRS